MAKIKLTKNEYKKQKDSLKMYVRYLPTLQLKKQQLQIEIKGVEEKLEIVQKKLKDLRANLQSWISLFSEDVNIANILSIKELITREGNIAGVSIPVFDRVLFSLQEYDAFTAPYWLAAGVEAIKSSISLEKESEVLEIQKDLLQKELKTTTQRVNLFEKIKIPETKSNIKKISVYLGDQQTAAVVRGKISKRNLDNKLRVAS